MYVALLTQSAKDTIHGGTGTVAYVAWLQWGDNTVASRKQHIFGSVDARLKAIYRAIDTSDYVPLNRFTHERVAGQGAGDSFGTQQNPGRSSRSRGSSCSRVFRTKNGQTP